MNATYSATLSPKLLLHLERLGGAPITILENQLLTSLSSSSQEFTFHHIDLDGQFSSANGLLLGGLGQCANLNHFCLHATLVTSLSIQLLLVDTTNRRSSISRPSRQERQKVLVLRLLALVRVSLAAVAAVRMCTAQVAQAAFVALAAELLQVLHCDGTHRLCRCTTSLLFVSRQWVLTSSTSAPFEHDLSKFTLVCACATPASANHSSSHCRISSTARMAARMIRRRILAVRKNPESTMLCTTTPYVSMSYHVATAHIIIITIFFLSLTFVWFPFLPMI